LKKLLAFSRSEVKKLMYNTTSVIYNSANGHAKMSGDSFDDAGSLSSDKVSRRSYCSIFTQMKLSINSKVPSYSTITSECFTVKCLFFMFFCPLSIVIGLGIVALILDKRDFLSSCGIVWPLLTGLFIVAILYCILMCVVYCVPEKYTKEARNPIIISKVTVSEEGYQQYPIKYVYELDPYLKLSYWFLIFLLSSVVIGSVSYFFTPGYACYYEFKDAVEELMLGYQILVYANIVVFCILGYIFSCFIYRIMINHLFTSTNRSSV